MLGALLIISFVPGLSRIIRILQIGEWDSKYNFFKVTQLKRSRPRNPNQKEVFILDSHILLSSSLLFGSLLAIASYSPEVFEYQRLFTTGLLSALLPFLLWGHGGSLCRGICLPCWMWHQCCLPWNKLGLYIQDGISCSWNEAAFPQGSLSEAIVINEDGQGCAKRKMFSFIIPDVNDTDKTVL